MKDKIIGEKGAELVNWPQGTNQHLKNNTMSKKCNVELNCSNDKIKDTIINSLKELIIAIEKGAEHVERMESYYGEPIDYGYKTQITKEYTIITIIEK